MKNLEQIRAMNALEGIGGKDLIDTAKKITTMIIDNGLIATAAFANVKDDDYKSVIKCLYNHLADVNVGLLNSVPAGIEQFIECLCKMDASQLRLVTSEAMEFMNYMRRFS